MPQDKLRTVKSEWEPKGIKNELELLKKENTTDEGHLPEGHSTTS